MFGFLGWIVLCFGASAIGALASMEAKSFYVEIVRPSWSPPGWIFGPVWTTLYFMMAVSAWLVWHSGGFHTDRLALSLFLVQLVLNAIWSWLFFAWRLGAFSFADIVLLWVFIVLTLVFFWRSNPLAGILLIPYLLWVSFAAFLNFTIWQMNPQILG
jgi:translocator protein